MKQKLHAGGLPAVIIGAVLLLAACGGTGAEANPGSSEAPATTLGAGGGAEEPVVTTAAEEVPAEQPAQESPQPPASPGSGSATLTVGGETWQFDSVLCAFGEQQIGQEGAEFVLSAIDNGLQLYATIDSYGHSVSLNDIEDFENPSVSLESDWSTGEFIELSGKQVRATALFVDYTSDSLAGTEGTLVAVCP